VTLGGVVRHRLAAGGAQPAHQALGEDAAQVAGEQFGADADLVQARQRAEDRVGVQGGEHLVAGERGAQGHGRGVGVADLADQDHVRVLAQQRAHAVGEVEP
jgi:hypothetical protein